MSVPGVAVISRYERERRVNTGVLGLGAVAVWLLGIGVALLGLATAIAGASVGLGRGLDLRGEVVAPPAVPPIPRVHYARAVPTADELAARLARVHPSRTLLGTWLGVGLVARLLLVLGLVLAGRVLWQLASRRGFVAGQVGALCVASAMSLVCFVLQIVADSAYAVIVDRAADLPMLVADSDRPGGFSTAVSLRAAPSLWPLGVALAFAVFAQLVRLGRNFDEDAAGVV